MRYELDLPTHSLCQDSDILSSPQQWTPNSKFSQLEPNKANGQFPILEHADSAARRIASALFQQSLLIHTIFNLARLSEDELN